MSSSIQHCNQCGESNRADAKFCKNCGSQMPDMAQPLSPASSIPPKSLPTGQLPMNYMVGGRYRILKLQGKGGMGAIYKVQDTRLGNALHVMLSEAKNLTRRQRFFASLSMTYPTRETLCFTQNDISGEGDSSLHSA